MNNGVGRDAARLAAVTASRSGTDGIGADMFEEGRAAIFAGARRTWQRAWLGARSAGRGLGLRGPRLR